MEKDISNTQTNLQIAFWRFVASLIGFAVRRKQLFLYALNYVPIAIGGTIAFLIGRIIGALIF